MPLYFIEISNSINHNRNNRRYGYAKDLTAVNTLPGLELQDNSGGQTNDIIDPTLQTYKNKYISTVFKNQQIKINEEFPTTSIIIYFKKTMVQYGRYK